MKELKLEELTLKQKLGQVMIGFVHSCADFEEDWAYALDLIKNRALGAIWVHPNLKENFSRVMNEIKENADYPILIMTDAESGLGEHLIGRHNPLGMTDREDLAYAFGKVTAVTARKLGYNTICNPLLDMVNGEGICGGNVRALGSDKHRVTALAKAEARAIHDAGILTVAKHYPSAKGGRVDSHMAEDFSAVTEAELIDYNLFPYIELIKEDLLDGIMVGHQKIPSIDPDHPASVSKKVNDVIRNQGFKGFAITDALDMGGIKTKYGATLSKGYAIAGGIDIALPWCPNKQAYEAMIESYEKGIITDERLNEAVTRVIEAQHKTLKAPKFTDFTTEDLEKIELINKDSIFATADEGLSYSISKEGKHLFVVMVNQGTDVSDEGKISLNTFSNSWYKPAEYIEKLEKMFPNSKTFAIPQFPTPYENKRAIDAAPDYDDVVFVSFFDPFPYVGRERHTPRILSLLDAFDVNKKISCVLHFGTPYVLCDFPHVPRIIIGGCSTASMDSALEVLAGNYPAKGKLTYDVKFN